MKKQSYSRIILFLTLSIITISCKNQTNNSPSASVVNSGESNNSQSELIPSIEPSVVPSVEPSIEPSIEPSVESSSSTDISSSSTFDYDPGQLLGSYYNPLGYNLVGETLEITFLEMVDQYGDCIYIKSNDFDMIIDAGNTNDYTNIIEFVENNISEDKKLELLVATHAHSDHVFGFRNDFKKVVNRVSYILDYGYSYTTSAHSSYVSTRNYFVNLGAKYCPVTKSVANEDPCTKRIYIYEDFYIDVLQTGKYKDPTYSFAASGGQNESSVTFILTYKNNSFFFGGDITQAVERATLKDTDVKPVTLLKANHHGSNGSNSTDLFSTLKPEIIVVSAAYLSELNHPHASAIERMVTSQADIYVNFTTGDLKIVSNGTEITSITGAGPKKGYSINNEKVTGEENKKFTDTLIYDYFY